MKTRSTTKMLRGGSVMKECAFEFRPIDKHGDCIDPMFCESLEEARGYVAKLTATWPEAVAWVIERHTSYYPARFGEEKYETIDKGGDNSALEEGGWNEED